MTQITAALVKELREHTGQGMMDCKKALEAAGGDIELTVATFNEFGYTDEMFAEYEASSIVMPEVCTRDAGWSALCRPITSRMRASASAACARVRARSTCRKAFEVSAAMRSRKCVASATAEISLFCKSVDSCLMDFVCMAFLF